MLHIYEVILIALRKKNNLNTDKKEFGIYKRKQLKNLDDMYKDADKRFKEIEKREKKLSDNEIKSKKKDEEFEEKNKKFLNDQ